MIRFYKAMMMKSVWMCTGRDIIDRAIARECHRTVFEWNPEE